MKCPTCGKSMNKISFDKSYDSKKTPMVYYYRTIYQCSEDDTWLTVETPIEQTA